MGFVLYGCVRLMQYCGWGYGGYCHGVVVLNLFIIILCGFVYFCNLWVLYCMDV